MNIFEKLSEYFTFPFVRYALIAGALIALCSSLLGVILVLKRFSHIGEGLSHVAFGAMAVAGIVGLTNELYITLPVTILCAVLLIAGSSKTKINGDAIVAMISVGALALGYLFMNIFSTSANLSADVCLTLFGSTAILTLSEVKVWLCLILAIIVLVLFILFYNRIYAITFDDAFARATGTKTNIFNYLIAIITAVVIVLAMNLVGSLLISALIIFPALAAMRVFKTFKSVLISASVISVICAILGILISILASTPVGCTIVACDIVAFLGFLTLGFIIRRVK